MQTLPVKKYAVDSAMSAAETASVKNLRRSIFLSVCLRKEKCAAANAGRTIGAPARRKRFYPDFSRRVNAAGRSRGAFICGAG